MVSSNLYLIVRDGSELLALPTLLQYTNDYDGYRIINFLPLVDVASKKPIALSLVHQAALQHLPVRVLEHEVTHEDELAMSICLSNLLVAPKHLYDTSTIEQLSNKNYDDFTLTFCHYIKHLLAKKVTQKDLISSVYRMLNMLVPALGVTQREFSDLHEIMDGIFDDMADADGVITHVSVDALLDSYKKEDSTTVIDSKPKEDTLFLDDSDFFSSLFEK